MLKFKDFANRENTVKGATYILIVTLMISNVLGVLRDHYLAQKIPTTLLDTYYAAFRIPDLVFNVIILGAVSSAFIPVFTRYISKDKNEEASDLASSVLTVGLSVVIGVVILLFFLMPVLIPLLVPEFTNQKQLITLHLSRILLLSPIFFGLSYFLGAILNSYKRFLVSSLAPLVYNLSIILATVIFGDQYGTKAVAIGVVVGAFLHMSIQIFPVKNLDLRIRLMWRSASLGVRKGVWEVGRLMVPRAIGLGAAQILLFGFTAIASGIGGGSVAIFSLSDNIQTLPSVVFGNSLALALFPTLSRAHSLGQKKEFVAYIEKAIISILFFLIPASIIFMLLRIQIVRIVLGSGNFGWEQTTITAQALGYFSISLLFSGLTPLLARSFYAINNTKIPMIFSLVGVALSIGFGYLFAPSLGVAGLALGFSIGTIANSVLLFVALRQVVPEFKKIYLIDDLYKIILATLCMAAVIQLVKVGIGTLYDLSRFWEVFVQATLAMVAGGVTYLLTTYLLGFRDFGKLNGFMKFFKRRLDQDVKG